MPQIIETYACSVSPTDQLTAYITDVERPAVLDFALVMTNAQGQKISVVLSKEDAMRLHAQLDTYIIRCAIKRI